MKAQMKKHVTPKWVDRLLVGVLLLILSVSAAIYVPELFGMKFRRTGLGPDSWSMTAENGGVRPLSFYYIRRQERYETGDIISFTYDAKKHHPGTETKYDPNGQTIKLVVQTSGRMVLVRGLYLPSTAPPCWVDLSDIEGRIVAGPISMMPSAMCRWMTMNYQLSPQDMAVRHQMLLGSFLHDPRTWSFRLGVVDNNPPRSVSWSPNGQAVALLNAETRLVLVRNCFGRTVYSDYGLFEGWEQGCAVVTRDIDEGRKWRLTYDGRLVRIMTDRLEPFDALGDGLGEVAFFGDVRGILTGATLQSNGELRIVARCHLEQFDPHGAITVASMQTPFSKKIKMGSKVAIH